MSYRMLAILLTGNLLLAGLTSWGLVETRQWALETYSTDEEAENWNHFREALRQEQAQDRAAVERAPDRGDEPPMKIWFSESFTSVFLWSLALLTVLYWSMAIMIVGALRTPNRRPASPPETKR